METIRMMSSKEAFAACEDAKLLVVQGKVAQACVMLTHALLSFERAGLRRERVQTGLLLAWAQGAEGRSWQALSTFRAAFRQPEFRRLSRSVRARAHAAWARALFDTKRYREVRQHARAALRLAETDTDRSWALLALAQAVLFLDNPDEAECYYHRALRLNPDLESISSSLLAYVSNLKGQHEAAFRRAEAGLRKLGEEAPANYDASNWAVERSALMVERATAKAFLRHPDARTAILEAQAMLAQRPGDTDLERARTDRALGLVLGRARERQAGLVLINGAMGVFRRYHAQVEYELTTGALNKL